MAPHGRDPKLEALTLKANGQLRHADPQAFGGTELSERLLCFPSECLAEGGATVGLHALKETHTSCAGSAASNSRINTYGFIPLAFIQLWSNGISCKHIYSNSNSPHDQRNCTALIILRLLPSKV